MEYRIEKKITFNGDTEHRSLYKWCLNEIETNDAKDGRDLIPFHSPLFFTGSSLQLVSELGAIKQYNDKQERIPPTTFKNTHAIVGVFHSGICHDGASLTDQVPFTMMGANRGITEFKVRLSESSDGNEDCQIFGIPSYDYEVDFRNETEPDWLQLEITLLPDKFVQIAEAVRAKKVDSATLMISHVSGFYSDWSPSISPDFIKVLTDSHKIEGHDDSFEIPTVGKVDQFRLTLKSMNMLNVKPNSQKFDFEKAVEEQELDSEQLDTVTKQAEQLKAESYARVVTDSAASTHLLINKVITEQLKDESFARVVADSAASTHLLINKAIGKLKWPLWFIFVVLVLILLK